MHTLSIVLIVLWSVFILAGAIAELLSTNFVSMWFSLGALCALISIPLGLIWWGQIILFILVSIVTLSIFYPLIRKYNRSRFTLQTNVNKLIGKKARVVKLTPESDRNDGILRLISTQWVFTLQTPQPIKVGDYVTVVAVEGSTLIVTKALSTNPKKTISKTNVAPKL